MNYVIALIVVALMSCGAASQEQELFPPAVWPWEEDTVPKPPLPPPPVTTPPVLHPPVLWPWEECSYLYLVEPALPNVELEFCL